jgi:hypothetical protein
MYFRFSLTLLLKNVSPFRVIPSIHGERLRMWKQWSWFCWHCDVKGLFERDNDSSLFEETNISRAEIVVGFLLQRWLFISLVSQRCFPSLVSIHLLSLSNHLLDSGHLFPTLTASLIPQIHLAYRKCVAPTFSPACHSPLFENPFPGSVWSVTTSLIISACFYERHLKIGYISNRDKRCTRNQSFDLECSLKSALKVYFLVML